MDLSTFKWPEASGGESVFPTFDTIKELLIEAESRDLKKGKNKFNELFFSGGKIQLKEDVKGTWKENAWKYCIAYMRSFAPKHEHKQAICAMIFEECLVL